LRPLVIDIMVYSLLTFILALELFIFISKAKIYDIFAFY
ncbi:hypothetical protein V766_02786, partial [Staphylococcus aureus F36097]